MTIRLQYIGEDPVLEAGASYPSFDPLRIRSHGDRLSGTILLPGGVKGELHPCAILLQGYPGYTVTYDIGQALRRAGIVAVNVLYRGCCGSEGEYSFHGMIEDAIQVATWLHEPNVYERYDIDPAQIFFVGHSMGGFTAINAMRRLPWIRGTAVMSPYDLPGALASMGEESVQNLLREGAEVLHCEGPDALFADALYCRDEVYGIAQAYDDLKDRNLYFVGATRDTIAPAELMIEPLWQQLASHQTAANQQYDMVETSHGFDEKRLTVSRLFGQWIADVLQ